METRLSGRHGLGDNSLEGQFLLLQVLTAGVLDLELSHGIRESALDLLLLATLELHGHGWVGNNLLNTADVRLELLSGLELLGESVIGTLELGGV